MTVGSGAGSFTQGQISDKKNRVVAASVTSHPRELWTSLLLQSLPVSGGPILIPHTFDTFDTGSCIRSMDTREQYRSGSILTVRAVSMSSAHVQSAESWSTLS